MSASSTVKPRRTSAGPSAARAAAPATSIERTRVRAGASTAESLNQRSRFSNSSSLHEGETARGARSARDARFVLILAPLAPLAVLFLRAVRESARNAAEGRPTQ